MLLKNIVPVAALFVVLFAISGHTARSIPQSERAASQRAEQHGNAAECMPAGKTKDSGCVADGKLPDHDSTQGALIGLSVEEICSTQTGPRRDVSTATKKQGFTEYGLSYPQPRGAYEVDHFIPLELGGSIDISTLWPEAANPTPGFHQKDREENYLHERVCSAKTVTLAEAQRTITADWLTYYNDKILH